MWVAAIVVDLKLNLLLFELLGASEYVKHIRLVSLVEDLLLVIHDEAGFTHGAVAYEDKLDRFLFVYTTSTSTSWLLDWRYTTATAKH